MQNGMGMAAKYAKSEAPPSIGLLEKATEEGCTEKEGGAGPPAYTSSRNDSAAEAIKEWGVVCGIK